MKSFSQYISEAFDKPYPYRLNKGGYGYTTRFKTDSGDKVDVYFEPDEDPEGVESWEINFSRNGSQDVTGKGDAMRIFATVIAVIKEFIKKENPQRFTFSAIKGDAEYDAKVKTGSREKLYNRMVKKYIKGYDIDIRTSTHGSTYYFVKK